MDFRSFSQPAECRSPNNSLDPPTNGAFAELWYLAELSKAQGAIRRIPIHTSPFTVGRRPDQHLFLESRAVSSRHAEIATIDQGLQVTDLGSTNGTFVNGQRIQRPAELSENDLIQFAERAFRINRRPSELGPSTESSLIISGFPSTTTAGSAANVTVTARDAYGNIATGYTGTIHFASNDPKVVLPADFTFSPAYAGKDVFSVTLETAGTESITVTAAIADYCGIDAIIGPSNQSLPARLYARSHADLVTDRSWRSQCRRATTSIAL